MALEPVWFNTETWGDRVLTADIFSRSSDHLPNERAYFKARCFSAEPGMFTYVAKFI